MNKNSNNKKKKKNWQMKYYVIFDVLLVLNSIIKESKCEPNVAIAIDCGATDEGKDADGRKWETEKKYLVGGSEGKSETVRATFQDPSLPSDIPYMNARVSNSEMVYKFKINSTSRYFLRLHFYPTSYQSYNISNSYFSVTAGGFTLVKNFSAAITAEALTQAYIVKEYSLAPMESEKTTLEIGFKASDKSFGFINGIELVPTQNLLDSSAVLVGFSDQSLDGKSCTTETMARLNVGGNYIPSTNDSGGLLRTWYDDTPYILGAGAGVTSEDNDTSVVYGGDMPKYIAPPSVYDTWRSMGPDPNVTLNFNLTWVFTVDPSFTYIVRLHFCDHIYTKVNQRAFNIYIYNQTATPSGADVIAWTGGKDVPIYKDFAVNVIAGEEQLQVALHPRDDSGPDNNNNNKPEYYDAILNGLELFKVSDGNKNLGGPNPTPSEALIKAEKEKRQNFSKDKPNIHVIGAASGVAAAFGLATVFALVLYKKKSKMPRSKSATSSWLPLYGNSHTSGTNSTTTTTTNTTSTIGGSSVASAQLSTEAAANCRHFSLAEMRKATKNFDESNVVGVGGFGKVYKGVIDGSLKVAIKKLNPSAEQGVHEFVTEIEMLSKLRHKHLVSLIGYCEENGEMALVYDFMSHGTLREHLYKGNKITLTWKQRLDMLIGAAKGLHYLHTGAKYTIIHRDVKTTNILLDENWVTKISDFGLCKTGPETANQNHVSTVVKGSFGYLDPEYFRRQQLTEKSDVYSFGVVLFEVLCARPALNPSLPKDQVSLADLARNSVRKGNIDEIIDSHIEGTIKAECLKKFVDTAFKCLSDHGTDRPSMSDLLWNLEFCLQLQQSGDEPNSASTAARTTASDTMNMHLNTLNLDNDADDHHQYSATASSTNDQNSSTAIFSQIVHQTGR